LPFHPKEYLLDKLREHLTNYEYSRDGVDHTKNPQKIVSIFLSIVVEFNN
jgi:hypothetical protein